MEFFQRPRSACHSVHNTRQVGLAEFKFCRAPHVPHVVKGDSSKWPLVGPQHKLHPSQPDDSCNFILLVLLARYKRKDGLYLEDILALGAVFEHEVGRCFHPVFVL